MLFAFTAAIVAYLVATNLDTVQAAGRHLFDTLAGSQGAAPQEPTSTAQANSPSSRSVRNKAPRCLLAIPDIHGDLQQAKRVLQFAGVTDSAGDWIAGDCTLVQTGDLIDRGHHSIAVLKLFEEIKKKAAAAGGEVITLMGNHELLSIQVFLHRSNPICSRKLLTDIVVSVFSIQFLSTRCT